MVDLNATQAAIRAGYSQRTANRIASRLLSKVDIQGEISELQTERQSRVRITSDDVVKGLYDIALNGKSESNRVRSYELLGRHLGMFTDKLEVKNEQHGKVVLYWPDNGRDPEITAKLKAKAEENCRNDIQGDVSIEL